MLSLDMVQTLAFAGLVLFAGYGIRGRITLLARYNIPAPVIGGLLVAVILSVAQRYDLQLLQFNQTLKDPLMIAFFTSIGFGASVSVLRTGGPAVLIFLLLASVMAVLQNVLGVAVALALGQNPLMGVLAGSVALTGGPGTAAGWAPAFEAAGVPAATAVGLAAAMLGIISGGLAGGPLGTRLIERFKLRQPLQRPLHLTPPLAQHVIEDKAGEPKIATPPGEDVESYALLRNLVVMLVAMALGAWLAMWFVSLGATFPAYIGAMVVAALLRNLDDVTGWLKLSQRTMDDLGNLSLSLFLAFALMTLELWKVASLAIPLLVMVALQVAVLVVVCLTLVYRVMGRDYEAAVMSSGFLGFMLGTTANAMANMEALAERYGPAPKAFLVVPMVGAFFIDFINSGIVTVFLNIWR